MKKKILVIFAGVFIAGSLAMFAGCKKPPVHLVFATGGTSGTYYPYGMELAKVFGAEISNVGITVQSTGASTENIKMLAEKRADIAIVQNDVLSYAFEGTRSFNGQPVKGLTTIATLYMEIVQIVVSPSSKINSILDMKGKIISVGDQGSGVEANVDQILATSGLTFKDINVRNLSFKDSGIAFQNGEIDGFFVTSGIPNAAVQDILEKKPLKILSISTKETNKLLTDYYFYIPYTIQKDVYKGVTEDVGTIAVKASLIVRDDIDEKLVYSLTKAMFEKREEIAATIEKGKELDIHEAIRGISVPLHSGAKKYYTEKGTFIKL